MNDIPHRPEDDLDIAGLVTIATLQPTDTFRTRLRTGLASAAAGDELSPLRAVRDRRERRTWTIGLAVAAATIVVVIGAVVFTRSNESADDLIPSIGSNPTARRGEALFSELADRRWVALERFDAPRPPCSPPTSCSVGARNHPS